MEEKKNVIKYGKMVGDDFYAGYDSSVADEKFETFVEVDEKKWLSLIEEVNSSAKEIVPDSNGYPVIVDEKKDPKEKALYEIEDLKEYLTSTDYVVIKIAEGESSAEEYSETLQKRKDARARINYLESLINSSTDSSND